MQSSHEIPTKRNKNKAIQGVNRNGSIGIRSFCPTRWTFHGETCATMLNNHAELAELWDWSLKILKDVNMKIVLDKLWKLNILLLLLFEFALVTRMIICVKTS